MKTIADFKRKMTIGSKWETIHRFKDKQPSNLGIRECTISQSNSFALATKLDNGTTRNAWCDYPKVKETTFIGTDTILIDFGYGTLIYKYIEG